MASAASETKTRGGYYLGKEKPEEIYFREGVRKSKKDALVATAVDEDSALVLMEQANMFYRCTCGEADSLADAMLDDGDFDEE